MLLDDEEYTSLEPIPVDEQSFLPSLHVSQHTTAFLSVCVFGPIYLFIRLLTFLVFSTFQRSALHCACCRYNIVSVESFLHFDYFLPTFSS